MLGGSDELDLENLAVSMGGITKASRGYTCRPVKGADKVGKICKTRLQCHIGDRTITLSQQAGSVPQPGTHYVLVRRDTNNLAEHSQKVKGA